MVVGYRAGDDKFGNCGAGAPGDQSIEQIIITLRGCMQAALAAGGELGDADGAEELAAGKAGQELLAKGGVVAAFDEAYCGVALGDDQRDRDRGRGDGLVAEVQLSRIDSVSAELLRHEPAACAKAVEFAQVLLGPV